MDEVAREPERAELYGACNDGKPQRTLLRHVLTEANGRAERDAALLMAEALPPGKRVTMGGDKAYDTQEVNSKRTPRAEHHPACGAEHDQSEERGG